MVRMEVAGLSLDKKTRAPILMLKDLAGEKMLNIWIGAMEAMAISIFLNQVEVPRPLTHDLMLSSMEELGAQLLGVDIVRVENGTYFAELDVDMGGKRSRIDCRPSDAVALALRAGIPILVSQTVLDKAGAAPEKEKHGDPATDGAAQMMRSAQSSQQSQQDSKRVAQAATSEKDEDSLADLLQRMQPDTKYKM
ncbi:bifunctional nuclease family protein [Halodesulfovibrio sp.]|uniref:bifunctional nuclease family protein n=1 Tax=Halodesulfovibrio sp. TaxID=1912772 RepID=UPI0025EC11BB|nr:bifunctional nuclease family protein [Halodesulfovibrio sp.]MCT4536087.1 bifunctional nuclease family protein [Halodesulfovibrio sp.]MCT4626731.1 bifunctional nuclease family protein [Halodesulfovibrio sp.]